MDAPILAAIIGMGILIYYGLFLIGQDIQKIRRILEESKP